MKSKFSAFLKLGESFRELVTTVNYAQIFSSKDSDDVRSKYIEKAHNALTTLLILPEEDKKFIPGYMHSEQTLKGLVFARKFSTENYQINSYNDQNYDVNFLKYDMDLVDKNKNVILKKSVMTNIHTQEKEVKYEVVDNWKEKVNEILKKVDKDIAGIEKQKSLSKVKKIRNDALNNNTAINNNVRNNNIRNGSVINIGGRFKPA